MNRATSHDQLTDFRSLVAAGQNGLRPEPDLTVSAWADEYRWLSQSSAEPGKWRTHRTPYLAEIMDCLSPSHPAEQVVFMKGGQLGGTDAGLNWVGYCIHHAPGLMLLVMPSLDMVRRNTSTRIDPLIAATPELSQLVVQPRSRESGNSAYRKKFPGGELVMTGANSASGLRSTPARYLDLDEIDAFPGDVDGEGDPILLAIQRTVTFRGRRKIYMVSTPTREGHSRIAKAYAETDQRRYFVPCQHCEEYSPMKWADIKWPRQPEPLPALAAWMCPQCGGEHLEHHKLHLLKHGEWRATAETDGRKVGFHLSTLYSPWETWADLAYQWEEVNKDPNQLKVFVNTKLGETWQEPGEAPEWERLYERREDYPIGSVPDEVLTLTVGVDVQQDRIEVLVKGWGRDKQSWDIDRRVIAAGDTANLDDEAWQELTEMLDETWPRANGVHMAPRRFLIDEGFNTQEVRTWARQVRDVRVMVCKGSDRLATIVGTPTSVDINRRGKRISRGMQVWPVGVSLAKTELYRWLQMSKPTDEDLAAGGSFPPGYCHHPQWDEEYFRQLCAEQRVTKVGRGGYAVSEWQKLRERNEILDLTVYARAGAYQLGVDRWSDGAWDKLEDELSGPVEPGGEPRVVGRSARRRRGVVRTMRSSWMSR